MNKDLGFQGLQQKIKMWHARLEIKTILKLIFSRIDSIMLLEEGFKVTSVDASDKMLKHALKTRWNRRKEAAFDAWSK
jgi:hypothetical protein